MAEDRMLSDEILLGLINKNSGGGGGGTTNYNNLENKPQIGGVTLIGNMTASDLGLASEDDVAGKQDVLTAGDYISIANDGTISVTQSIGVYDVYSYVVAGRAGNNYYYVDIQKYENGVLRSNTRYVNDQCYDKKIIDDRFSLQYNVGGDFSWHFVLLTDSNEHKEGESIVWRYNVTKDFTETFNVSHDESTDLATKGDVNTAIAGKQDILTFDDTPTENSNNPVKSNGIYDALSGKQAVPTEISYADWQQLTPQQQETGSWLVEGVPGGDLSARVSALESITTGQLIKTDPENLINTIWRSSVYLKAGIKFFMLQFSLNSMKALAGYVELFSIPQGFTPYLAQSTIVVTSGDKYVTLRFGDDGIIKMHTNESHVADELVGITIAIL